jgi:TANK-binding kinase 1
MELCTGGSLYDVIDSPENAYGLSEAEFKQVIYDVGMFSNIIVLCVHVSTCVPM